MLLVIAPGPHGPEHHTDRIALRSDQQNIDPIKIDDQTLGKVEQMRLFSSKIQHQSKDQKTNGVGL